MTRRLCVLACLGTVVWTVSNSALGQSWPRFRGPNGVGTSEATTVPIQWTTRDYNWRVKLPGTGYSSPVVSSEQLFVTCGLEADATQIIRCLRTSDGRLVWKREFPSTTHGKHKFNCYASASPVVDSQRVYMAWATPERYTVIALTREKGQEVWRRDLGPFVSQHGFGASPTLVDGLLVVANDQDGRSSVIGLDCSTGETRWERERRTDRAAFATPCVYQPEGGSPQVILSSSAHGITGIDPSTGDTLWELPVFENRVVGSPVVACGLVFASAGVGGVGRQMFAVRPGDPKQGTEAEIAYEITGSLPYVPSPVACGELLFLWFDKGVVTCLNAPTGEVVWRERIGGEFFGSPVRVADRLYCISRAGEMVVLAASDQFRELARISLEEPSNSTPAVADGVMYLRTASHLMAIGGK
ncbi:MAG: PQQ-binding-like beta-propeller repeat protein [Planctomycetota bacterium]|jgi:outer membrane protein assembly factor BamB